MSGFKCDICPNSERLYWDSKKRVWLCYPHWVAKKQLMSGVPNE